MTDYCTFAGCDFTEEDSEDRLYSPFCMNCGRRDPMADLVLTISERESEAMIELDAEWVEKRNGLERVSRRGDGRVFFISTEGRLPVLWEREGNQRGLGRRVGEFESMARAVIAANTAEAAPYLDDPPF